MKLTTSTLTEATELAGKHPCVTELLKFYEFVTSNQVYESYVARVMTLQKFNNDLIENPISILGISSNSKISIDGIENQIIKQDKEIDRVLKYLEKQPDLIEGTELLRAKLLPDEQESLNKDKRLKESLDRPFKPLNNGEANN